MNAKISIITVCYNAEKTIAKTLGSIREQTAPPYEYIIIDGGSTDRTLAIIEENRDIISRWSSESDQGIADAMNKGIRKATGEYLLFLHADDYLAGPGALLEIEPVMTGKDICIFDYFFETGKGLIRRSFHNNFFWLNFKGICHQSVLCRRSLFDRVGMFDDSFRITMDYDFFLRCRRRGISFSVFPELAPAVMGSSGLSSRQDWGSLHARFMEEEKAHLKNCSGLFWRIIYFLWWTLYPWYRRVRYLIYGKTNIE